MVKGPGLSGLAELAQAAPDLFPGPDSGPDPGPNKGRFTLIKDGTTTTVGIIEGQGFGLDPDFDLLVKRFNYKGPLHSLARRLSGSRARHLFEVSLELFKKGLSVAEPMGFIEDEGEKNSFYFSRYVPGAENLATMYVEGRFDDPPAIASGLGGVLSSWHASGAVHGDLKWTNILVRVEAGSREFLVIDLDQSSLNTTPSLKGIRGDLVRFVRYGLYIKASDWVEGEFFPAYLASLPPVLKSQLDVEAIREDARREFEKKEKARS